jgi:hypothetical protein
VNFTAEADHCIEVRGNFGANRLDGDLTPEGEIFRLVNLTHTAAPEQTDDAETARHDLTFSETVDTLRKLLKKWRQLD